MAVEARRGCGFRKMGGLYLVCDDPGAPCDRLPFVLEKCPCCGAGIKPSRGFTWIDPIKLFEGDHDGKEDCTCPPACPACFPAAHFAKILPTGRWVRTTPQAPPAPEKKPAAAGLLWIGEEHYKTPGEFMAEGAAQGFSRRINVLPNGFMIGETWVFMAHRKAKAANLPVLEGSLFGAEPGFLPGIVVVIRPQRVERIVAQSAYDHYHELMATFGACTVMGEAWSNLVEAEDKAFWNCKRDVDRGITLVPVPDNDPDHKG